MTKDHDLLALARAELQRAAERVAVLEAEAGADAARRQAETEAAALRAEIAALTATKATLTRDVEALEARAADAQARERAGNEAYARTCDAARDYRAGMGEQIAQSFDRPRFAEARA